MLPSKSAGRGAMLLAACALCAPTLDAAPLRQSAPAVNAEPSEPPIACNLGAFDAAERKRYVDLVGRVRAAAVTTSELPDGFVVTFSDDSATILEVAEFVTLERRCCPFLRFAIEVDGSSRVARLKLTGRAGVKEFLAEEFGLK